jgi:hypothetical protein
MRRRRRRRWTWMPGRALRSYPAGPSGRSSRRSRPTRRRPTSRRSARRPRARARRSLPRCPSSTLSGPWQPRAYPRSPSAPAAPAECPRHRPRRRVPAPPPRAWTARGRHVGRAASNQGHGRAQRGGGCTRALAHAALRRHPARRVVPLRRRPGPGARPRTRRPSPSRLAMRRNDIYRKEYQRPLPLLEMCAIYMRGPTPRCLLRRRTCRAPTGGGRAGARGPALGHAAGGARRRPIPPRQRRADPGARPPPRSRRRAPGALGDSRVLEGVLPTREVLSLFQVLYSRALSLNYFTHPLSLMGAGACRRRYRSSTTRASWCRPAPPPAPRPPHAWA